MGRVKGSEEDGQRHVLGGGGLTKTRVRRERGRERVKGRGERKLQRLGYIGGGG